jgi:hypothetical protein
MASGPPFTIPQGKSGPWEKVGGPELSDGDVRQWPGLPLYRPISETHYLTTLATAWVKDQKLDQPREFHQIVPTYGLNLSVVFPLSLLVFLRS